MTVRSEFFILTNYISFYMKTPVYIFKQLLPNQKVCYYFPKAFRLFNGFTYYGKYFNQFNIHTSLFCK